MKNLQRILIMLVLGLSLTSCEIIGDIFQAGIGVGIFIVIAVLAIIIYIISRFRK